MASRQELKRNIETLLERTGIFNHVNVKGDLDYERNSIVIEYIKRGSSSQREFLGAMKILKIRIDFLIRQEYFLGIDVDSVGPDEKENYKLILKRTPCEGVNVHITDDVLRSINKSLGNKYFFKR
ncbi:MAG: hypothetical protein ABIH37_00695 [archaeon]